MSLIFPPASGAVIEDRSDGMGQTERQCQEIWSFLDRMARFVLLVCISCVALVLGAAVQSFLFLSQKIPSIEQIKSYEPPMPTQIVAENGELIGEFYAERRYVVPVKEVPQAFSDALAAAYGRNYWNPNGSTVKTIADAAWKMMFATRENSSRGTVCMSWPDP